MFFRLLFLLTIYLLSCSTSPTLTKDDAELNAQTFNFRGHNIDVVKIYPNQSNLRFYYQDNSGKAYRNFTTLKEKLELQHQQLLFAMNGGMYLKDGSPQGLYIEDGKALNPLDTIQQAYGNFYLQPNGIFYLKGNSGSVVSTTQYLKNNPSPDFATQSGPMLVIENNIHPVFQEGSDNLNIRNGVGVDATGAVYFAITKGEINLYDFALFFQSILKCPNALYLDGFVSKAYIPALDRRDAAGNFGVIIGVNQ